MSKSVAIEGDFVEIKENGLIFDVKGLSHPSNKVICFLRYYPHSDGDRFRDNIQYKKIYDLKERFDFLKENFPKYIFHSPELDMQLQGVNIEDIKTIFKPNSFYKSISTITKLTKNQQDALDLCNLIVDNTQVTENNIGISGSIMVELDTDDSDIDIIVYGTRTSNMIQDELEKLYENKSNSFRKYNQNEYNEHYEWRAGKSNISFEDFMKSEKRKLHNAKFRGIDVFIRYIKNPQDWPDDFADFRYKNYGRVKLEADITDSTDSIFTPCTYKINCLNLLESSSSIQIEQITEICSYRGRFCEQAVEGERVFVEGKLEKVIYKNEKEYFRLQLGENDQDKMIVI